MRVMTQANSEEEVEVGFTIGMAGGIRVFVAEVTDDNGEPALIVTPEEGSAVAVSHVGVVPATGAVMIRFEE